MAAKMLKEYLDNHQVKYIMLNHSPAFTSQEIAASAHVSGKEMAKTVIVKANDQLAMVVLPANDQINFGKLASATGLSDLDLAKESEFKDKFPECEVGAMPPFGNLYQMPVYLSSHLTKQDHILFNAGSHYELMEIAFNDFERLVKPKVIAI